VISNYNYNINMTVILFSIKINVLFEKKDVLIHHVYKCYKKEIGMTISQKNVCIDVKLALFVTKNMPLQEKW